jgi:hypothetical protein
MGLLNEKALDYIGLELRVSYLSYYTKEALTVTQQTSRSTGVTLDTPVGQIVLNNSALLPRNLATFTVTNEYVFSSRAQVLISIQDSGANPFTVAHVSNIAVGSFDLTIRNTSVTTTDTSAEVINFLIIHVP